jgi:glycosyltransferase involved in cell wall biosynthesis
MRKLKYWRSKNSLIGTELINDKRRTRDENKLMKIGIVTGTPSFGGVNRTAMEAAVGLEELGFETELIFLLRSGSIRDHAELLHRVKHSYLFESTAKSKLGELLSRSIYLAKKPRVRYDLLIAYNLPAARVAFRIWKDQRCPYICVQHDPGEYTFVDPLQFLFRHSNHFLKLNELKWLTNAKVILTNSKKMCKLLKTRTGLESSVLYPSSSLVGRISKKELPKKREDIFAVIHRLGYDQIFPALALLLEDATRLRLEIAGSTVSGRTDKVVKTFRHLTKQVQFVYNPTDDYLTQLYQTSRGLLHPSVENFNLVALEAASMGCPVLTYRQSGIFEIFEGKSEEGFFDVEDTQGLAELAEKLLDDEQRAIKMGSEQYDIASSYTLERHVSELKGFIEEATQ